MSNTAETGADGLRILVVSDAAPSRNGVGAYYQDLCHVLEPRLARLELLCPLIIDGEWRAGLVFPMPGDATQKICFPNYWKMKALIRELQPQVIVVATPGVYGMCAAHLARHVGIPFVTGFHTSFEHLTELYWGKTWRGKIVENYFLVCNRYLFNRTALVLGNSDSILEQAHHMGARELRLIGTPLASDFLSPAPQPHSGAISKLLFAGRLAREKNIETLLDAAERLPDLHFSIAGDGPLRAEVEGAADRLANLQYLGWLERAGLREQLDAHDALLLPSHYETFGTIALEAMAREKVAVVSTGCGISLWPQLAPAMWLMKEEEPLYDSLVRLNALTPDAISALAKDARERALSINQTVCDEWIEVFREVMARNGAVS